ncbi:putative toxin-antitoxin system toxin component, PIN family [Fibrella aquatilis]|uniref:Toxin-antitoxin system toxin component, PIN family n=1 Tax=Fibrella aquatilis TaxID=2817059 RepID=A0A939G6T6_9BACT|nr:putative toxin-antitoxin system toxin component, PIN family [Fibrella aquatilis]MBO0931101.1 putative toxin-antitoxin system toxin component, PIN family [Fibrella aquatilis]
MRVVIDTNCLLASIPPRNPAYALYKAFVAEQFTWVVSNEILTEYAEQLTLMYSSVTTDLVLTILTIAPNTLFQEAYFKWQLIEQDHDDDKFVDVAIAAGADYLVTNDGHFDILKTIDLPKVTVVSLQEFLALIN